MEKSTAQTTVKVSWVELARKKTGPYQVTKIRARAITIRLNAIDTMISAIEVSLALPIQRTSQKDVKTGNFAKNNHDMQPQD